MIISIIIKKSDGVLLCGGSILLISRTTNDDRIAMGKWLAAPMSNRQGIEPNEKLLKSIVREASVPYITKRIGSQVF